MNSILHNLARAIFVIALGACGTAQVNDLPDVARECTFSDGSCTCYLNQDSGFDDTNPRECSARKVKGACCSDSEECQCYSLGCTTSGGFCTCGIGTGSSETECPATGGSCCVDVSAQQCTCDANRATCPSGSNPVDNCRISVLTCEVLGRGDADNTSSCSALKVVDETE